MFKLMLRLAIYYQEDFYLPLCSSFHWTLLHHIAIALWYNGIAVWYNGIAFVFKVCLPFSDFVWAFIMLKGNIQMAIPVTVWLKTQRNLYLYDESKDQNWILINNSSDTNENCKSSWSKIFVEMNMKIFTWFVM